MKTVVLPPEMLEPKKHAEKKDAKEPPKPSPDSKASPASKPPGDAAMKTVVLPPEKLESKNKGVKVDALAKTETAAPAPVQARRPFPWPILLAILIPLGVGGLLSYHWTQQDQLQMLRTGWIVLCSFVPGFAIMVVIGSLAQIRRRPVLSSVSLILGAAYILGCWWAYDFIVKNADSLLR